MKLRHRLLPYARYALMIVTGSLVAILLVQTNRYERDFITHELDWKSLLLVAATALVYISAFALISRRVLASVALGCGILVLLATVSLVKFSYLRASLHALDFYYYGRPTELIFLSQQFPKIFYTGLATIVLVFAFTWFLFAVDGTRVARKWSLVSLAVSTLVLVGSYQWLGQRSKVYHFNGYYHVSAAAASAPEAIGVLMRGGFLDGAYRGGTINSDPVQALQNQKPGEPQPNIISILHESSFPIGIFPIQCGGKVPEAIYTSSNGQRYDLRVETYGGATWLTEYGVLLGLSTYYFGEARSFIGYSMEGRVKDDLAQQMKKNGYETVAIYPSPRNFVNTGPFYTSLGFDKILDFYDIHAKDERERDKFYFGKALDVIRHHKASGSKKPLFLFLWTMATHAPYDYTLNPGVKPMPDTICAKNKSWVEYIRRMLWAEEDQDWLKTNLKADFPGEPFLIFGYGDHQPFISREFLDVVQENPVTPARNSIGYKTFFRISGVNYEPDFSVVPKSIDTPFIGNVMMLAARQPRHGFYNDRDKLMQLCKGRYNDCPHQDEILSFHQRLIDSNTIINK